MIRLTFISSCQTSAPREYDTDDLGVALATFARDSFGPGPNAGPGKWIVCFVVEQEGSEFEPFEVARTFRQIAGVQHLYAVQDARKAAEGKA